MQTKKSEIALDYFDPTRTKPLDITIEPLKTKIKQNSSSQQYKQEYRYARLTSPVKAPSGNKLHSLLLKSLNQTKAQQKL